MRTDSNGPRIKRLRGHKPGRRTKVLSGFLASLVGALLIATLTPTAAQAAGPYIWITRVDGKVVVQGKNFTPNVKGIVKASFNGEYGQKDAYTNQEGYFWITFYALDNKNAGTASARAWINKVHRTTSAKLGTNGGTSSSGSSGSTVKKPASTPTTQAPSKNVSSQGSASAPAPSGWKLFASDDFNGNSLNRSNWGVYEGRGNHNIGWRKSSAVSVYGGAAHVKGNNDIAGGFAYQKGFTYGRYEIRAKLSKGGGGYNTALMLWPNSERWPEDVEVDISEIFSGAYGKSYSFHHWAKDNKQTGKSTAIDTSQYHTYAVEWDAGKVQYSIDGKVTMTITEKAAVPHNPHFMAIQLDVANKGKRVNGTTLDVDWVKMYKR